MCLGGCYCSWGAGLPIRPALGSAAARLVPGGIPDMLPAWRSQAGVWGLLLHTQALTGERAEVTTAGVC